MDVESMEGRGLAVLAVLRAGQVMDNTVEWEDYMAQEGALIILPKAILNVGKVEPEAEIKEAEIKEAEGGEEKEMEEDLEAT